MTRLISLLAILLCNSLVTDAQTEASKFRYGFAIIPDLNCYLFTNIRESPVIRYKTTVNASFGFTSGYQLTKRSGFAAKVFVSSRRFHSITDYSYYRFTDPNDPLLGESSLEHRERFHLYLDVVTDYQYLFDTRKNLQVYGSLGLVNSFSLTNQDDPAYKPYMLAAKEGVGFRYAINKKIDIYFEPQMRVYLGMIHRPYIATSPLFLGVELGTRF